MSQLKDNLIYINSQNAKTRTIQSTEIFHYKHFIDKIIAET